MKLKLSPIRLHAKSYRVNQKGHLLQKRVSTVLRHIAWISVWAASVIANSVFAISQENQKSTIRIAAIDWCPQICPNSLQKGYVLDIVESVYSPDRFELDIQFFPWSRAIKVVRDGTFHVLLSPAKDEAPDLIYPHRSVGKQQMCFFVNASDPWFFDGVNSLHGLSIGMAQDTSIEELNEYRRQFPEQFQLQPYLKRFVKQNVLKMQKGRIDTFLFTRNTTLFDLASLGLADSVREAGCVSEADIFVAFTPQQEHEAFVQTLADLFDKRMLTLKNTDQLASILAVYGIRQTF